MIQDVTENLCQIALSVFDFRKTRTTIKKVHGTVASTTKMDLQQFLQFYRKEHPNESTTKQEGSKITLKKAISNAKKYQAAAESVKRSDKTR